jgi:hypothetical protein
MMARPMSSVSWGRTEFPYALIAASTSSGSPSSTGSPSKGPSCQVSAIEGTTVSGQLGPSRPPDCCRSSKLCTSAEPLRCGSSCSLSGLAVGRRGRPGPHPSPLAWATTNARLRICGEPAWTAPTTIGQQAYPDSSRSESTLSAPRVRRRGEFSITTQSGRTCRMTRAYSNQSPESAPESPADRPATLMSWHGKPPQMTSIGSREAICSAPTERMSPSKGTPGHRSSSMDRQKGSISQKATVRKPARSSPMEKPPIPENRSSTFTP